MSDPSPHVPACAPPHRSRPLEAALILLSAALAYGYTFKLPFYPVFYESDHLIFMYEGWRMFNGEWIYRDFFEFTFPGSQTFYCVAFLLFGTKYWIAGAATVLIASASCWITLRVSREVISSPLYLLPAVIFIFFGFRWAGIDPSHRMFSPIFMMAAVLMILRGTSLQRLIWAGFFCGFASFFTQQRGVVAAAAIVVFLFIETKNSGQPASVAVKKVIVLGASFLLTLFLLCLPFIIAAGPVEFFRSTLVYTALYYKLAPPNHFGVYLEDLRSSFANNSITGLFALAPILFYAALLPLAVVAAAIWTGIRRMEWAERRAPMLLALVSVLSLLSTTAPNQGRIFQIAMPMLVLVVWCLAELISSRSLQRKFVFGFSALAVSVTVLQVARFQTHWDFVYWKTPTGMLAVVPTEQSERYLWLTDRVRAGDLIFEPGNPFVYFPLQLKNPTRFGQIWPSGYTRPEHVSEVIADLERTPPEYIIWDNLYNLPAGQRPEGDNTEPLSEFVRSNYAPVGTVYMVGEKPIQIWQRNGE